MGNSGNYRGDNNDTKILGRDGVSEIDSISSNGINRLAVSNSGDDLSTESQGRVRTAENTVIFDAYFTQSKRTTSFNEKLIGGGTNTRDASEGVLKLQTTTASGDRAVYQSKYFRYIAGQTYSIGCAGTFGTTDTNCVKRMGYFDDNNGIFLQYDGSDLSFNIRSSATGVADQSVTLENFNIPNSFTFDPTKYYLWIMDFLWQGAGPVSLYVFDGSVRTKLHTFSNSGQTGLPYMRTPSLPIRFEIENTGTVSSSQTLMMSCVQMSTEGRDDVGIQNRTASNTDVGGTSVNTSSFKPLVSIRLNSAYNRALIRLLATRILATSNDDIVFRIIKNPTLTAPSWSLSSTNSIVEYDVSATSLSGGVRLDENYISKSGGSPSELAETFEVIQSDYDGNVDIITLAAKSLTSSATVYGSLIWTELF